MALSMRFNVNGGTEKEIRELQEFLKELEVPVTSEEIGFPKRQKSAGKTGGLYLSCYRL